MSDLLEAVRDDADDWDVLAVDVAGEDGDTLFALVIRRKVRGDHLLLSERYYRFDVESGDGTWLSNGIERRVNGSLASALKVLYSAVANGDLDADDPMTVDSRDADGLDWQSDVFDGEGDDVEDVETVEATADARPGSESYWEDVEDDEREGDVDHDASGETVVCEECGGDVDKAHATRVETPFGDDMWYHADVSECEGEGDD